MNEYLRRYVEELGGPFSLADPFIKRRFSREMAAIDVRHEWIARYAWAIPSEEALDLLVAQGPIVEIGAGGGYWAYCLRERGVDVIAVDLSPEGRSTTEFADGDRHRWTQVLHGGPEIAGQHPDRTLFLCWPPLGNPMANQALDSYLAAGGSRLAYVGEGYGGCTADDAFHKHVDQTMTELESAWLPSWPGIHDSLTVYEAGVKRPE